MDTDIIMIGVGIAILIIVAAIKFLKGNTAAATEQVKPELKVVAKKKESTITYGKVTLFFGS